MDLDQIIAEGQAKLAARERQLEEQRQKELEQLNAEQIAEKLAAEKVESALLTIVKPVFTEVIPKLEPDWQVKINETRSATPKKVTEITISIELCLGAKRAAGHIGNPKTYSLAFVGIIQHGGQIFGSANQVLLPGVRDMPVGRFDRARVEFELNAFVKASYEAEAKR